MNTLWLHCGAHKTATTSLQTVLSESTGRLEYLGYRYVLPAEINTSGLLNDLHAHPDQGDEARIKRIGNFLSAKLNGGEHLIVSHESFLSYAFASPDAASAMRFYGSAVNAIRRIVQVGFFDRIVPIFYVRRQDQFLESLYFEELKQGTVYSSFEEYVRIRGAESISWKIVLDQVSQLAVDSNVIVRPFEEIHLGTERFLRGFLEIFGWPSNWPAPPLPRENTRPSQLAALVHRLLVPGMPPNRRRSVSRWLFRHIHMRWLPKAKTVASDQSQRILSLHAEGNREVFKQIPESLQHLASHYVPR